MVNYDQFSFKKVDKPKKNAPVIYLSDMIKNYEKSNIYGISQHDKTTTSLKRKDSKRHLYKEVSNYSLIPDIWAPQCHVDYRNYSIKISDECEPFDYPFIECKGYCQSKSMIWKTGEEIQEAECCSMTNVFYMNSEVFCKKKLEPNEIKTYLNEEIKDEEFLDIFYKSFNKSSWTDQITFKRNTKYLGYFTVKIQFDARCSCQNFD